MKTIFENIKRTYFQQLDIPRWPQLVSGKSSTAAEVTQLFVLTLVRAIAFQC